jgi:hypothetical protein
MRPELVAWATGRVFENHHATVEAFCDAGQTLEAKPDAITSIGVRQWAHVGQAQRRWYNVIRS